MYLMRIIRLLCLVYLAALTYLLITPKLPEVTEQDPWWIALLHPFVHFLSMLMLTLLVLASNLRLPAMVIGTLLLLYAIGTEFLQTLFPPRTFEMQDLVQNVGGIAVAWGLWALMVGVLRTFRRSRQHEWQSFLGGDLSNRTTAESENQ